MGIFVFGMDDLILDATIMWRRLQPTCFSQDELHRMHDLNQRRVAVLVANWHEDEILEAMISGNLSRIDYQNYQIFLGVYPNDEPTLRVARGIEQKFPSRVRVIVNAIQGPTSKGQMLNQMFRSILKADLRQPHELFVLQDSEDLIHPLALKLMNWVSRRSDFIQTPVFSLPNPLLQLVAGTYVDEFAEIHTRDLLARAALGAPIPSAGVGTCLSRSLVLSLRKKQRGDVLDGGSLTEDYQLGHMAARLGFKTTFVCRYVDGVAGRDFVATREYFPDSFRSSVRQKTRWTLGITLQGRDTLGWGLNWLERYFLWRDRRSLWNAVLILASLSLMTYLSASRWLLGDWLPIAHSAWFQMGLVFNLGYMCWRLGTRMKAVAGVYGIRQALMVPVRWPVANLVNTWTAFCAAKAYRDTVKSGRRPGWVKTQHRLPTGFGA